VHHHAIMTPRGGLKKNPHSRCSYLLLFLGVENKWIWGASGCGGRRGAGSKRIHPYNVAFVALCCSANSASKVTPLHENAALNPLPLHDGR
jgi:hypothetical protein